MCIYCNTNNYRKIYEHHIGIIPVEDNGRTYEIHHLDGNHSNNSPDNLIAVTLQEHYDLHAAQQDWGACRLMKLQRMDYLPEEISELASRGANKRIKNGTHHFIDSDWQRSNQLKRVENGTHNWQGDSNPVHKLIAEGRHNLQGGTIQRVENQRRIDEGTHNFIGSAQNEKMLADGNHPSQVEWTCEGCGKSGKSSGNYKRWHSKDSPCSCWNKS